MFIVQSPPFLSLVTPFGECGLKYGIRTIHSRRLCHSLWGVWVEISLMKKWQHGIRVTPFGECGLKFC